MPMVTHQWQSAVSPRWQRYVGVQVNSMCYQTLCLTLRVAGDPLSCSADKDPALSPINNLTHWSHLSQLQGTPQLNKTIHMCKSLLFRDPRQNFPLALLREISCTNYGVGRHKGLASLWKSSVMESIFGVEVDGPSLTTEHIGKEVKGIQPR